MDASSWPVEQLAQPMLCIRVPLPRLVLLLVQGVGRIAGSNAARASLSAPSYFAVFRSAKRKSTSLLKKHSLPCSSS
jgi:hypothetical protein